MASARFILGVALSGGLHVVAFVQMSHAKTNVTPPKAPVVIEVDTAVPPPPPPAPVPEEKPAPEPAPIAKSEKAVSKESATPPPVAAQAGKVLAAASDDGPAEFTMVQGNGIYAGGITSANGTGTSAVNAQPRVAAAVGPQTSGGGSGSGAPTGPDRSKPARPVGSDWDCSSMFPATATVDTATVVVVVRVRVDGGPEKITIVSDPGQGFGNAARACAMRQRYAAAEDHDGRSIAASTAPFRVRFTR